ncbi:MAG: hypothetical protein ACT4PT_03985, partial [Methanobacteriota archaeon]
MTFVFGPEQAMNVVGAALVAALGVFVATIRNARPGNLAFATYCIFFGVAIGLTNVVFTDRPAFVGAAWLGVAGTALVADVALIRVAQTFPDPLAAAERRLLRAPVAIGAAFFVGYLLPVVAMPELLEDIFFVSGRWIWTVMLGGSLIGLILAISWGYLFLLAARFARVAAVDPPRAERYAALSIALSVWPAAFGAIWLVVPLAAARWYAPVSVAAALAFSARWLMIAAAGHAPRVARRVALVTLAVMLGAMAYTAAGFPGAFGLARTTSVLLFGYAILRHQVFGLDVKVRWGVSKSTIAAAF